MALLKEISLENGIIINYHRINTVLIHTNNQIIIEVSSYVNQEQREKEKSAIENKEEMNIFIETEYFDIKYDEEFSVIKAYDYLKTLDKYKNTKDI